MVRVTVCPPRGRFLFQEPIITTEDLATEGMGFLLKRTLVHMRNLLLFQPAVVSRNWLLFLAVVPSSRWSWEKCDPEHRDGFSP